SFLESFVDARRRLSEWPEGFDGTARWSGDGRVEIVWPVAAGEGCDGEVRLGARDARHDVRATRLAVAEGVTCELDSRPGLVVLRAQGKLSVAGELRRSTRRGAPGANGPGDARAAFMELAQQHRSLSDALSEAWTRDLDATVLIAGGDL